MLLHRTILSNFPIKVKSKYKIFYESRWQEVIAKVYKTRIQILMISKWYFNCAALISITWRTKLASVGKLCGRIYRQIHNKTNSWNNWHFRSGISLLLLASNLNSKTKMLQLHETNNLIRVWSWEKFLFSWNFWNNSFYKCLLETVFMICQTWVQIAAFSILYSNELCNSLK